MRVIGGRFGGLTLYGPKGLETRPTSDRAREALFNILGAKVTGARFLDLYAGTGAVGIEALSRGAAAVTMVESASVELIRKNLARLPHAAGAQLTHVIRGGVEQAARTLCQRGERYDIIFADPPWDAGLEGETLRAAAPLLEEEGVLILEARHKTAAPSPEGMCGAHGTPLTLTQSRRYGDTVFHFYRTGS